jgi:hypothetical protein
MTLFVGRVGLLLKRMMSARTMWARGSSTGRRQKAGGSGNEMALVRIWRGKTLGLWEKNKGRDNSRLQRFRSGLEAQRPHEKHAQRKENIKRTVIIICQSTNGGHVLGIGICGF